MKSVHEEKVQLKNKINCLEIKLIEKRKSKDSDVEKKEASTKIGDTSKDKNDKEVNNLRKNERR